MLTTDFSCFDFGEAFEFETCLLLLFCFDWWLLYGLVIVVEEETSCCVAAAAAGDAGACAGFMMDDLTVWKSCYCWLEGR